MKVWLVFVYDQIRQLLRYKSYIYRERSTRPTPTHAHEVSVSTCFYVRISLIFHVSSFPVTGACLRHFATSCLLSLQAGIQHLELPSFHLVASALLFSPYFLNEQVRKNMQTKTYRLVVQNNH